MRSRSEIDPELHVLRSAVRALDGRERQELETARFNVFAAFEQRDPDAARRWVTAFRAGLLALRGDDRSDRLREMAGDALGRIETAIDEE
jgi:hypothetical protein